MPQLTATDARKQLFRLIDLLAESHDPVLITGPRNNVVMLSEEDWRAVQETLALTAVPGMVDSIKHGMATTPDEMAEELDW